MAQPERNSYDAVVIGAGHNGLTHAAYRALLRRRQAGRDPGAALGGLRRGVERTSQAVIEGFLGRPVSPQALLENMARAASRRRE